MEGKSVANPASRLPCSLPPPPASCPLPCEGGLSVFVSSSLPARQTARELATFVEALREALSFSRRGPQLEAQLRGRVDFTQPSRCPALFGAAWAERLPDAVLGWRDLAVPMTTAWPEHELLCQFRQLLLTRRLPAESLSADNSAVEALTNDPTKGLNQTTIAGSASQAVRVYSLRGATESHHQLVRAALPCAIHARIHAPRAHRRDRTSAATDRWRRAFPERTAEARR